MGTVWVARHEALATDVAVKLVTSVGSADDRALRRFEREAALLAKVRSPHVVSVLDAGTSEELGPYIVMELLDGHDLAVELEARGRLDSSEVLTIVEQTCAGLKRAHDAGLVHRDLKPANLFLCDGMGLRPYVKVLDFGVALASEEETKLTEAGAAIGTRSTMSPEQAAGKAVDHRSDLYSLALVVFRMLTGTNAIARASLDALGLAAYRAELPRPSTLAPNVPNGLDAWFAKATAYDVEKRFQDVGSMLEAMQAALANLDRSSSRVNDTIDTGTVDDEPVLDTKETSLVAPIPAADISASAAPVDVPDAHGTAKTEGHKGNGNLRASFAFSVIGLVAAGVVLLSRSRMPDTVALLDGDTTVETTAPNVPTELHLSLLMDLSGDNRRRGTELERAARVATQLLVTEGGIRGRKVVLHVVDDQGATGPFLLARAEDAMRASSVPVLLGPLLSPQATEVLPFVAKKSFVDLSATATAEGLAPSDAQRTFVGLSPSDHEQAIALGQMAKRAAPTRSTGAQACKRVAIFATKDAHGEPFARALEAELLRSPRLDVGLLFVESEARRSYEDLTGQLIETKTDCLALIVSPKLGGRILDSIKPGLRKTLRVLAGDSLASRDFVEFGRGDVDDTTATSVAEGVEGIAVASASATRPEYAAFRRHFRTITGTDTEEPFAPHQFDAVILLALAIEAQGFDATSTELREAMVRISKGKTGYGPGELGRLLRAVARGEDVRYEGASGDLHLLPNGRVKGTFESWHVREGKIVRRGAR